MLDLYQVKMMCFKSYCTLFKSINCRIFKNIFIIYISLSISEAWGCDTNHDMWEVSFNNCERVKGTSLLFLPG